MSATGLLLPARAYADLVGKPFVAGARGPEAYDCLGLATEITRRRGVDVPRYESTAEEFERSVGDGVLGPCTRIDRARAGCVVLLRSVGGPVSRHIGVMIDPYRMIHASEDAGQVVVEVLARSVWAKRILGFYFVEGAPA